MRKIYLHLCLLLTIGVSSQDYISPFDFQLYLSGTFGELRDNHFHAGIDVKTNTQEGKKLKAIQMDILVESKFLRGVMERYST